MVKTVVAVIAGESHAALRLKRNIQKAAVQMPLTMVTSHMI